MTKIKLIKIGLLFNAWQAARIGLSFSNIKRDESSIGGGGTSSSEGAASKYSLIVIRLISSFRWSS